MANTNPQANYTILHNSRFYILASTVLFSLLVAGIVRVVVISDQLFYIRIEQVYGLLSIVYWYIALTISPIGYVIGKERTKHLAFARRAIGVSAAYFAVLHLAVSLWGQLGGPGELSQLPTIFQWSLVGGLIGTIILCIMAATSFDKVIAYMTFKRWKWLHRLGYIGGILVVLHVWTIGTHVSYSGIQIAAFVALVVLAGLETYRVTQLLSKRFALLTIGYYSTVLFLFIWSLWVTALVLLPVFVQNYHAQRHTGSSASHQEVSK